VAWLYRAIERHPVCARAFQELGNLLRAMRRYVEAESVLKRGVEAAPTVPELSLALGGVCLDCADSGGAKIAFARALSIVPGHADALVGFGVALQYEGDFARAAERFRRVLAHDPGHHRARMNLGYCLIELGQLDDGIACLRAAVQAAPHNYGSALRMLISAGRGDSGSSAAPPQSAWGSTESRSRAPLRARGRPSLPAPPAAEGRE